MLPEGEHAELVESIRANGLRNPIDVACMSAILLAISSGSDSFTLTE